MAGTGPRKTTASTYGAPVAKYHGFAASRSVCVTCTDNTVIQVGFFPKGAAKSMVAVQHQKLADRSAVAATKKAWGERFDRLSAVIHSAPRSG